VKVSVHRFIRVTVVRIVLTVRPMKTAQFLGLVALTVAGLRGQTQPPTTGTQYWSTVPIDCSLLNSGYYTISLASGGTGYVCIVSGTFDWLAAGGSWNTAIRIGAPASGPIGVDVSFYDTNGNNLTLDNTSPNGAASSNDVNFVLKTNQPSEIDLLGAPNEPQPHKTTQTGTGYAVFYCSNQVTCATVLPQLLYSNASPQWSLSVPIAWNAFYSVLQPQGAWPQWSVTGVNDATHFVTFVVYNQNAAASTFTLRIYDSNGFQVGASATTPLIPGSNSATGEAGTYGATLSSLFPNLPSGVFKVTVDGGTNFSTASFLQFSGNAATSLQVAYDTTSATSTSLSLATPAALGTQAAGPSVKRARVPSSVHPQ
jgi:hypothetical protein